MVPQRPLNKVYWGTLSGTANLGTHACVGPDKGHRGCKYDVVVNDEVDVDDLLAIINAWGACPQITLCTSPQFTDYQCPADVAPYNGSGSVDVDDLLAIITYWGPCAGPPPEGGFPPSLNACFNNYCSGLTGALYQQCVNRCVESYCSQTPTPPDCN